MDRSGLAPVAAMISYRNHMADARDRLDRTLTSVYEHALKVFETYLRYSFEPGVMQPKFEATRPMKGIAPLMIAM